MPIGVKGFRILLDASATGTPAMRPLPAVAGRFDADAVRAAGTQAKRTTVRIAKTPKLSDELLAFFVGLQFVAKFCRKLRIAREHLLPDAPRGREVAPLKRDALHPREQIVGLLVWAVVSFILAYRLFRLD